MLDRIYSLLLQEYGPQGWWPVRGAYFPRTHDPFEITVGAVLTQNTSWSNAAKAIDALREMGVLDPISIINLDREELARIIRSSGYYNQKARRLREVCRFYLLLSGRESSPTREELLAINGIGPETADSILLYAYRVPIFIIDAYTKRMFTRIGLVRRGVSYGELQQLFMNGLPSEQKLFNEYHALIVRHVKEICRKDPLCVRCVLSGEKLCAYGCRRRQA